MKCSGSGEVSVSLSNSQQKANDCNSQMYGYTWMPQASFFNPLGLSQSCSVHPHSRMEMKLVKAIFLHFTCTALLCAHMPTHSQLWLGVIHARGVSWGVPGGRPSEAAPRHCSHVFLVLSLFILINGQHLWSMKHLKLRNPRHLPLPQHIRLSSAPSSAHTSIPFPRHSWAHSAPGDDWDV